MTIEEQVALSRMTTLGTGGPARYLARPETEDQLREALRFAADRDLPVYTIGLGSNLLVADDGVDGLVLRLAGDLATAEARGDLLVCGGGAANAVALHRARAAGLGGFEFACAIPGTAGGGVWMNAGAYGGEISNHLVDVEIIRDGRTSRVSREEAGFRYRHTSLEGAVVLGARFRLPAGDRAELMRARRDLLIRRNRAQPVNMPNSGSMFKNPPGNHAAKLIDEAGLKGTRRGGAGISELHANFIVNHGGAKAADVLGLLDLARAAVLKRTGIALELEIKLVGFPEGVHEEHPA